MIQMRQMLQEKVDDGGGTCVQCPGTGEADSCELTAHHFTPAEAAKIVSPDPRPQLGEDLYSLANSFARDIDVTSADIPFLSQQVPGDTRAAADLVSRNNLHDGREDRGCGYGSSAHYKCHLLDLQDAASAGARPSELRSALCLQIRLLLQGQWFGWVH